MNRLQLCNSLLHDCHRVVYSISGDVVSRCLTNVNNRQARIFRNLGVESSSFVLSTNLGNDELSSQILSTQNVSVREKKVVPSYCNKSRVFGAYKSSGTDGFIRRSNFLLASASRRETFNCFNNVRHFSDVSAPSSAIPVMQLTGFWKTLSESAPVEFSQNALIWVHTTTGLPWWATIILTTWSLRAVVTLPLALYQNYIIAKVENLKYEMDEIVKELKEEANYGVYKFNWTETYARSMYNRSLKKEWQKLIERDNCHPVKSAILVVVQLPMWVTISASIRNLCYMLPYPDESAHAIYLELANGGLGWIMNLTEADHSLTIPVTLGLFNLAIIEMQCMMRVKEPTKVQTYLTNFFRFMAVGMIPLAAYIPAGMSLYWASSSAFGIIQNLTLMSPKVRRFARIPETDSELEEPYRHLYQNFRHRIGLKDISETQQRVKKL